MAALVNVHGPTFVGVLVEVLLGKIANVFAIRRQSRLSDKALVTRCSPGVPCPDWHASSSCSGTLFCPSIPSSTCFPEHTRCNGRRPRDPPFKRRLARVRVFDRRHALLAALSRVRKTRFQWRLASPVSSLVLAAFHVAACAACLDRRLSGNGRFLVVQPVRAVHIAEFHSPGLLHAVHQVLVF